MLNLPKIFRRERTGRRKSARVEPRRFRPVVERLEDRSLLNGTTPTPTSIALQPVLSGLVNPLFATNAGDASNRLFVLEQRGVIRVAQPGAASTTVFLNLSNVTVDGVPGLNRVRSGGEQGLLGLTFHPDYENNGRFFIHYTTNALGSTSNPVNQVAEYQVSPANPNVALATETLILRFPAQPFGNHNGGSIEFGQDGYLYIAKGDGGSGDDPGNRAQDRRASGTSNGWFGKLHRIDIDSGDQFPADANRNYTIPASNPFVGVLVPGPAGTEPLVPAREEIYAWGLRNPYRFSFDRQTGQLVLADVGQGQREEVNIIQAGGNYGWRAWEGTRINIAGDALASNPGATVFPIAEYDHSEGASVSGGYVYRGTASALPAGSYIFGDFTTGRIFLLHNGVRSRLTNTVTSISSFGQDEDGELYIVSYGGSVQRITSASPGLRTLDNGGANFSATANFFPFPAQGFANDVHYAAAGSGSETATWTFTGLTPGRYRVSATWSAHPNRATNSPFSVYNGAVSPANLLGTVSLNQELAPNSLSENGVRWQDLGSGSFAITGSVLTVRLTDQANEFVIADAIRIEWLGLAGDAEVVVQDGLTEVPDDTGVVNFGNTTVGAPQNRTFTVRNLGGTTLTLAAVSVAGAGFSVFSPLGSLALAPGASTTFTIRQTATSAGVVSAMVSFGSNDPSEPTFNFTVVGTVNGTTTVAIIDDGDAGFSQTGFTGFGGQGFNGDVSFAASGSGLLIALAPSPTPAGALPGAATWTFSGLTPGLYRVSATWSPHPNRATNAPYAIYDGIAAAGTLLDTVRINHELAPSDFTASGAGWRNLGGPHFICGTTLTVRLTNNANEFVIADAVRIERLAIDPTRIIDDSDVGAGFAATAGFTPFQFQGFNNNVTFAFVGTGSETATWTFAGLAAGTYQVAITWTPYPNRATNAPFTAYDGIVSPGASLGTVPINQESAPSDFSASGTTWQVLGNFTITGTALIVQLTDLANEYVIADAIRIERLA